MSWLSSIPVIGNVFTTIADRISPDKSKVLEAQSRINEAEVEGAPPSKLRLWRSFLGWVLALTLAVTLVFEIIIRPIILTYWPDAKLPPLELDEIQHLLRAMLGLGI